MREREKEREREREAGRMEGGLGHAVTRISCPQREPQKAG
jgi:hypothetical protein